MKEVKSKSPKYPASNAQRAKVDGAPLDVLKLAGKFPDFPDLQDLRSGYGQDAPRPGMD